MSFNAEGGRREFVVDPVPRVIDADEWTWLARGLEQRVRALDALRRPTSTARSGSSPTG